MLAARAAALAVGNRDVAALWVAIKCLVTKPCEFIRFGAMDVTKSCEFIRFGAMAVTKPYKFIGFGAIAKSPNPVNL